MLSGKLDIGDGPSYNLCYKSYFEVPNMSNNCLLNQLTGVYIHYLKFVLARYSKSKQCAIEDEE